MNRWIEAARKIAGVDPFWREKARERLRQQTRPEGSLGVLEQIVERLVAIQKKERLRLSRKRILIFAGDHGVAAEGVSRYPREVTPAMVLNFLKGGATINALARHVGAEVLVIDVGVDADFEKDPKLIQSKIRKGTRNMVAEAAMTERELDQAMAAGWDAMSRAKEEGIELVALGEMGIANTTSASAIVAALLSVPAKEVTGRGTGLDDLGLERKVDAIQKALALHQASLTDPLKTLQCLGGYELAALTGAILAGASLALPMVMDGWIVSASVLVALKLNPAVLDYLFFAHQSHEKGHKLLLEKLEAEPILNLAMRLGEASGAALAMGILEAAARVYNEVATFSEAGVRDRER